MKRTPPWVPRALPWVLAAMLLLSPLLLLGRDDFQAGVRAYREGRFPDALASFTAAERAAGHGAPVELVLDRALAALQAGELRVCEFSAEKLALRGGPATFPLRDFLLGSASFARCERAKAETTLTDPDPTAFERAIAHAEAAAVLWQRAAWSRDDWPAARRNVERALRELDELRQQQAAAERSRQTKKAREPEPPPERDPADKTEEIEQEPTPQQGPADASPDLLARLLAVLEAKEAEKRALRRARREVRSATVEQDW